ncbi:helix-turn-helix domain-containing protein [Streptomyces phaeochromogenes]|uniref:helix-turn-helix domain-containing protein n=1 Tax=Streptomyces phaeochromogenes TaxID=1923 RepID=UPI00340E9DA6
MTVADAAKALGVSTPTVYSLIRDGSLTASAGPRGQLVSRSEVFGVASARRVDAVRRHRDLLNYAKQIRSVIWPPEPETIELSDGRTELRDGADAARYATIPKGRAVLSWLDSDAVAVFGPAVIHTLADLKSLKVAGACPWCWARDLAAVRGGLSPRDNAPTRVLLGDPCSKDLAVMKAAGDEIDKLWAGVKADDRRRRDRADRTARAREIASATADVDRATRRLRAAKAEVRGHRPGAADNAVAFTLRQQAASARRSGSPNLARELALRADRAERGE